MPRGRPRIHPTDEPTKSPRGRKATVSTPVYDSFAETRSLVAAVLRSRGDLGAAPETLHKVVEWARSVRAETDLLRDLAARQRRPRIGTEPDRVLGNEMNRALLDGVLEGSIMIRVADDGSLSFARLENAVLIREISFAESGEGRSEDANS